MRRFDMKHVLPIILVTALLLVSCNPGEIVETTEPIEAIQEEPSLMPQEE
jgi:hypothetical protein